METTEPGIPQLLTKWTGDLSKLVLVVDGITLFAGVPANLLAFYIFIQKSKKRVTSTDVFLLSLTISDLIFLFFLPFRMIEASNMRWNLSKFLCSLSGFIFFATIYNSSLLLTAVSVERYLGVAFPIKYRLKRHPRYAVVICVIIWVVSMAHCSSVYIVLYNKFNNTIANPLDKGVCYDQFTEEQLAIILPLRFEMSIMLFCIPFLICSFSYFKFILIISRLPNFNPQKRFRAIGLALATLVVFVTCFMPYNVSHVVGYIKWYSPDWRVYALLTSTFNACLDPFIFYFSSSFFQGTFNHFFQSCYQKLTKCLQ